MAVSVDHVRTLLKQHCKALHKRRNVVATGVGYKMLAGKRSDTLGIICSVKKKLPLSELSAKDVIPQEIDSVPTDVVETGVIRAFQVPTGRFRPAPGGVSAGHKDITAGTLGCWVKRNGQRMILSNNHVLANSNNAAKGDVILQPGPFDGGLNPNDKIAVLEDFVPILFSGTGSDSGNNCSVASMLVWSMNAMAGMLGSKTRMQAFQIQAENNLVDAAIARPFSEEDVDPKILNIGEIQGVTSARLGMALKKNGRTTGFTQGELLQIDVTVDVQYDAGRSARFNDQLLAGPMSQGGDSGSVVLDDQDKLVGLLFAGSEQTTIMNRIENVFEQLDLSL